MRSARGGNRGAEAARDQVATASAYGSDEAESSGGLETGRLQGARPPQFARPFRVSKPLLAEDRRNHSVGRAVADAGGNEKDQEHCEKTGKLFDIHEVYDAERRGCHGDEVPKRHDGAADLVGEPSTKRTRERAYQRSQKRDGYRDLGELSLDQQRKRC